MLLTLVIISTFESMNKNSLGYSATPGLKADTHLVGQRCSWLATIFYLGCFAMTPFSFYLVTKFEPVKIIGVYSAGWAAWLTGMAACKNFAGLATV
ncbi:hypothetical protein BDZ45DRAFT_777165 [Acephala macrosclerotiorum]|nr:hypothetical protein BDZ45DRAFT_777165 [Acephala macrosclerotiorum]